MTRWAGAALAVALAAPLPAAAQAAGCSAEAIPSLEGMERASCYVELGRLQEAAWMFAAAGDRARAHELVAELEAQMRETPADVRSLDAEGVDNLMATYLVTFPSGVRGVFKPGFTDIGCMSCTEQHERAAFLLDTIMGFGLTPLTLVGELELPGGDVVEGSLMYFVDDSEQSAVYYSTDGTPVETEDHKPDRLRLLDVFLGNSDRHQGNWLVRNTGEIAAIDHNRAFSHDNTFGVTNWRQQLCRIRDLDALRPYVDRFADTPVEAYGEEFRSLLAPDRLAAFEAARTEILDAIANGVACEAGG